MDNRVNRPLSKVDIDYFITGEKRAKRYKEIYIETRIAHVAKLIIGIVGLEPSNINKYELKDDLSIEKIVTSGVHWSYPSDLCIFCKQDGHPDELEQLNITPINYLCEMPPEFLFMADEEIISKVKKDMKENE